VLLSATALPFWSNARLMGALFLASGASTGMAAISLLLYLSGESAGDGFKKVKRADRYAIMFEILVLAAFLVLLGGAAGPLVSGHLAPLFWGGLVGVGLVIPLLVDLIGLKLPGPFPRLSSLWGIYPPVRHRHGQRLKVAGLHSHRPVKGPDRGPLPFPTDMAG
jgi:hypothetical protein